MIRAYRWYGGKYRIVHILGMLIPEHEAYYEPFMGSAALLLNHPRSGLEVLNDLDPDLAHFMQTLADREKGKVLVDRLCSLWYGENFFEEALDAKKHHYIGMDEITRAELIFVLISQSYNALRKSFGRGTFRDTYAYRKDIQFHIPQVYERLENVHILNMDGVDLIEKVRNNVKAFAFVDPPYRKELRGTGADHAYFCEMPYHQQIRLLKALQQAKCKVMLCGYKAETGIDLYDRYLLPYGYKCYKVAELVKACQNKSQKDTGYEFIWVNYKLPSYAKYVISLTEYTTLAT